MLTRPPREKEWVSWLLVGLWIVAIFATVPIARALQGVVTERLGRSAFGYMTLAAVGLATAFTVRYLIRSRQPVASYVWLAAVAAIFVGSTIHLWRIPEEAAHFVQYGGLGVLAYRALSHRVRDATIYVSAAMFGALTGMVDEFLQWMTPDRFWDLRDIWIDAIGAALPQVAIAKGLRPSIISGPPRPASVRIFCRVGALLLAILAVTLLNTPQRIAWYTQYFPSLAFLNTNESTMLEYGYRFVDPETGPFRSRLTLEELRRTDQERGVEAAEILDEFQDPATYGDFLKIHTPGSDPFVHEARVHLFRRNRHLLWSEDPERGEHQKRVHRTVAWRENRILEKYFPETLRHSSYVLPADQIEYLASERVRDSMLPAREVESTVSRDLVTSISERQILGLLGLALLALVLIYWRFGRARDSA